MAPRRPSASTLQDGPSAQTAAINGSASCGKRLLTAAATLSAFCGVLACLVPSNAWSQERGLDRVADDLATLDVQLRALTDKSLADATIMGGLSVEARLSQAQIFFLLGNHEAAALSLLPVMEVPDIKQHKQYDNILQYLSESLVAQRQDNLARTYLLEILERPNIARIADACRSLIEIADRDEDWSVLPAVVQALSRVGGIAPDVAYTYAKSLLERGRVEDAMQVISQVPTGHPLSLKAQYVQAVALLEAGKVDEARTQFASLSVATSPNETFYDAPQVHSLATLDVGRILTEQGSYDDALEAYGKIPRGHPKYEQALYELIWTYVRAANRAKTELEKGQIYTRALQRLEIFLLAPQDGALEPEARLLLGNILLQQSRFNIAAQTFGAVVDAYEPVLQKLTSLQNTNVRIAEFFIPLLHGQVPANTAAYNSLPPLVATFAGQEQGLKQAVEITSDLQSCESALDQADALMARMAQSLTQQRAASFSYTLQDVTNRAQELQNALLATNDRLQAVHRQIIAPSLSTDQAAELSRIIAERATFESAYRALPQSHQDYEKRDHAMNDQTGTLQSEVFRLRWLIEEQQMQVSALNTWRQAHAAAVDADVTQQFVARLDQERRVLADLERARQVLVEEVAQQRTMSGMLSAEQQPEEALRRRYADSLEREQRLLEDNHGSQSAKAQLWMQTVAKDRLTLASYRASLETFQRNLTNAVQQQVQRSETDLNALQEELRLERLALDAIKSASDQATQMASAVAVLHVHDKFDDMVLRGGVGRVDVAWSLKEAQTHDVNFEIADQADAMQHLESLYKDIMARD